MEVVGTHITGINASSTLVTTTVILQDEIPTESQLLAQIGVTNMLCEQPCKQSLTLNAEAVSDQL